LSGPQVRIRADARRDLDRHSDYLLAEAGAAAADRFVSAARQSFDAIAENPGIGPPLTSANPRLAGMRKWRVKGFPRILIFYVPARHGVRIVRVLHAAQDWWALVDVE
jgi:toxin ParE1/3/4